MRNAGLSSAKRLAVLWRRTDCELNSSHDEAPLVRFRGYLAGCRAQEH